MQLVVADVESTLDSESEHGGRDDADISKDKHIIKGVIHTHSLAGIYLGCT